MPYAEHALVNTPSEDTVLWKYLDLAKFLSLVTTSKLHFTRIDNFEDPYEGIYSNPRILETLIEEESDFKRKQKLQHRQVMEKNVIRHKKNLFVSCWHANHLESAAMWKLYSMNEYGVAIKTKVKDLKESLIDPGFGIQIGRVKYLDYDYESIPSGNLFYPVTHKRLSFEFEQEVRAIIWFQKDELRPVEPFYSSKIDLVTLIKVIYVSPTAPDWIIPMIKDICIKYSLNVPVVQSQLMKLTY